MAMKKLMILMALVWSAGLAAQGSVKGCQDCGTVRAVDVMNRSGETSGAGAVIGAVIGGIAGHQVGGGRGQDAATAAGAVGGAAAGHQTEKNRNTGSYYRVTVDMESGGTREVNVADPAGLKAGSKVRVNGNNIEKLG
jgi:outer membrane lipoprotein SlyB